MRRAVFLSDTWCSPGDLVLRATVVAGAKSRYVSNFPNSFASLRFIIVKCDATRPSCRRCMIYGKECTGYPSSFAFRTYKPTGQEGDSSQGSALLKCKDNTMQRRLEGEVDRVGGSNGPASTSSVPHSPVLCLEWQSLCYFFHQHVLQVARSPCEGHLAFFPELYQERGDDPCLRNAILSVSYLTLFNTSGVQQLQVHARKHYGAALNSLIATLNSNELALRDEVVAASLFLSMFTVILSMIEAKIKPLLTKPIGP